jgi:acetyl-CoA carboxylase biotin carboxyl carrier protein
MAHDATFPSKALKELGVILDECNLSEIEYEKGDVRLRLVRSVPVVSGQAVPHIPVAPVTPIHPGNTEPSLSSEASENDVTVKSPMVGVAYLSPEPGAKPFVQEGDTVREGQTLLIIEAMKVLNPVRAKESGVVRKVLVQNAQPVEFDEPLFAIEAA